MNGLIKMSLIRDNAFKKLLDRVNEGDLLETVWLRKVRPLLVRYQKQKFITENDGQWQPPTFAWIKRKQNDPKSLKGGMHTLIYTGALARSLTTPNADGWVEIKTGRSIILKNSLPYAFTKNTGLHPRRKINTFSQTFRSQVNSEIKKFIIGRDDSEIAE